MSKHKSEDYKITAVKYYLENDTYYTKTCENKYAIIGTMLFKKASIFLEGLELIYKDNIRTNGEYYVDNLIEPLIKKGYKIKIFDVDYYLCWGTPNDYKTYNYWLEYFSNF
jgi:bifunctional N-acetylglucosamine-1-phosphate-uridyltransferase/glucosamine-1-phosphate-acetyltransferase GlmU-like protein